MVSAALIQDKIAPDSKFALTRGSNSPNYCWRSPCPSEGRQLGETPPSSGIGRSMMPSRRVDNTSLFRYLLIACALLGFYLDVLPTPTPGVATSDLASSGGKSPLAPRRTTPSETRRPTKRATWLGYRSSWLLAPELSGPGSARSGPSPLPWPSSGGPASSGPTTCLTGLVTAGTSDPPSLCRPSSAA